MTGGKIAMKMKLRRRIGLLGLTMAGMIGPALFLAGCGGGGGAGNTTGPNPEVKIVPPTDAQGKTYSIEEETKHSAPRK